MLGSCEILLTDSILQNFQVSKTFNCSLICSGGDGCVDRGTSSTVNNSTSSTDSTNSSSGDSEFMCCSGNKGASQKKKRSGAGWKRQWRVSSGHWSQDGCSLVLATVACNQRQDLGVERVNSDVLSCLETSSSRSLSSGSGKDSPRLSVTSLTSGDERTASCTERNDSNNYNDCAKLLFFSAQTGKLTYVRNSPFKSIDAVRFIQGGARKCLAATSDDTYAIVLWNLDQNTLDMHYPLPAPVVPHSGLDVHPTNNLFIACCVDGSVLLLHLNASRARGIVRGISSFPVAAFDCEGLVYACALGTPHLHLFGCDDDSLDREPASQFSSFDLSELLTPGSYIASIAFSPDEKALLVCSDYAQILVIDAFNGSKLRELRPPGRPLPQTAFMLLPRKQTLTAAVFAELSKRGAATPCPVTLSPDGRFVLWGDFQGNIMIWRAVQHISESRRSSVDGGSAFVTYARSESWCPITKQGSALTSDGVAEKGSGVPSKQRSEEWSRSSLVAKHEGHKEAIRLLLFNGTYAVFASIAGDILALWQPPPV